MVTFESLGTVSYSPSIVTMAVSVAVCEIFSVKEWRDLDNRKIVIPHLYLAPPQGVTPLQFREDDADENRMIGLP